LLLSAAFLSSAATQTRCMDCTSGCRRESRPRATRNVAMPQRKTLFEHPTDVNRSDIACHHRGAIFFGVDHENASPEKLHPGDPCATMAVL
jgi:hypothetical protein